jgi:predicted nucleic acid-binding protein
METVLELYQLMPYNYEIAKLAGEIVRDNKNLVEFPDAAIAATALVNEAELLTLNKKHFAGIKGLELFDINRLKRILLR